MTTNIQIDNNKVTCFVMNDISKETEAVIFRHRYAIVLRSRWSLLYNYITQYFIDNGERGCYIGERYDNDNHVYDIWDLSKIFQNVSFIPNSYSHLTENPRKLY